MDLILWRHAEAEEFSDQGGDLARALTRKGHRQAKQMADWLRQHAPAQLHVLASPAVRAQQTAAALELRVSTCRDIAPNADVATLLQASGWNDAATDNGKAVLLVGHQPTLGEAVARLLSGRDESWALKKGAICWLRRREHAGNARASLIAALAPEHLVLRSAKPLT